MYKMYRRKSNIIFSFQVLRHTYSKELKKKIFDNVSTTRLDFVVHKIVTGK
jgi:hypothetical protein